VNFGVAKDTLAFMTIKKAESNIFINIALGITILEGII
jgi:hypothetical protein